MLYLLQALSGWLLAALVLGVFVGFFTSGRGRSSSGRGWAILAPLFLAGGEVVAYLRLLPGRYGFWLETALLLFAVYLVGCLLGSLLRRLFASAPKVAAKRGARKPLASDDIDVEDEMLAAAFAPIPEAATDLASGDALSDGATALSALSNALDAAGRDAPTVDAMAFASTPSSLPAMKVEQERLAAAPAPSTEPARSHASGDALSEDVEALTGSASALAVAVAEKHGVSLIDALKVGAKARAAKPSALPALNVKQEAQAAAPAPSVAVAPAACAEPVTEPASRDAVCEGGATLTGHASALDAAVQAALATNRAAQALMAWAPAPVAEFAATEGNPTSIRPPPKPRAGSWADEDNLRFIRGIGEIVAHHLHGLDIWRFAQIAEWTPENAAWIAENLPHHGTITPKHWIAQARLLAGGVDTDFSRAFRANGAPHYAPLDGPSIEEWHRALPQAIAPDANDELYAGRRPLSLLDPPMGEWDDLTRIAGIDSALAARLSALGIWTYAQIAHWSPENGRWIGAYLAEPGRVERETWVAQANALSRAAAGL